MRTRLSATIVVALLGAVGIAGVPAAAPSFAAAPTIVSKSTKTSISLPAPGPVVLQSIRLTKGNWTLMAKATPANFGASGDFFRCELVDATHATVLDGATTFLNPGVNIDVITNLAVFKARGPVTISQECSHDGSAGDGGGVEANSTLVAFVTPPAQVRVVRTSASTTLTTSGNIDVADLNLPKGTWVVAARVTPVVLSAPQVQITCSDDSDSGGVQRLLGTASGMHAVSTIFKVGAIATLKKPGTVTLACNATADGAYVDAGAELWAWKAAAVQLTGTGPCPLALSGNASADALVLRQNQNCSIGSSDFSSELIHAHLRAGTWVAFGGVENLVSQGPDDAQCELVDPAQKRPFDVSTAAQSSDETAPTTGVANLAVVDVTAPRFVNGMCGEISTNASGVSTNSGWAFIKP